MKNFITGILAVVASTTGVAAHTTEVETLWSTGGFLQPESILADKSKPQLYVTNINGHPLEDNGQGYISLVSTNGKIIEEKWVEGLGAPKGMALYENLLYVADLQTLHIIDHQQGKLLQSIKVHDSKMLNDVAIDKKGNVYISDFLGGGIYRFKDNKISKWISSDLLLHPNGLFYHNKKLVVGTWGKEIQEDFSSKTLGSLFTVNIKSAKVKLMEGAGEIGNLDGIAMINNTLYVNDWINGNVFQYKDKKASVVFNAGANAADIGAVDNQLLVPMMFSERIDSYLIK